MHGLMTLPWWVEGAVIYVSSALGGSLEAAVVAPLKYPQPHVPVCLGAGGQLVLVCPHRPTEGQLPLVELHSLEVNPGSSESL